MNTEFDNKDIEIVLNWFLSFIEPSTWLKRKQKIEEQLTSTHEPKKSLENLNLTQSIAIHDDRIGWYLYLVGTFLYAPLKYEPMQGARIVPIFKRFGQNFDLLRSIGGINSKVKELTNSSKNNPDSTLFELLVVSSMG